jgi:hypothetical protein
MDWQAMDRVAWSRESRLASWTGLGLGLVDSTRPALGEVIKPFRCCQRQAQNYQPQGNIDLQHRHHACPQLAVVMMIRDHRVMRNLAS